jgi:hypothetical protein
VECYRGRAIAIAAAQVRESLIPRFAIDEGKTLKRMRIALLLGGTSSSGFDYFRPYLTPGGDERWQDVEYVPNPSGGTFDGLVVHQSVSPLAHTFQLTCPSTRTLLVIKEPPEVLTLPEGYTRQFACVVSQDPRIKGPGRMLTHSAHHWFVEVPQAAALQEFQGTKTKLLSAVTSNKGDTAGHRQRVRFLRAAKDYFGEALDWFGRGVQDIGPRKSVGLLAYKYHICLENVQRPHYWTEKLADAYVSNCVPFYWGAPNIRDYFDPASLIPINVYDIGGSIARIQSAIAKDRYSGLQEKLAIARRAVVCDYHPYEMYARILKSAPQGPPAVPLTIRPHTEFDFTFGQRMGLRAGRAAMAIRETIK